MKVQIYSQTSKIFEYWIIWFYFLITLVSKAILMNGFLFMKLKINFYRPQRNFFVWKIINQIN